MELLFRTLPSIALALFLALWAGRRAHALGMPRVTAYLLVGILLGPHVAGELLQRSGLAAAWEAHLVLGEDSGRALAITHQIALGFILFRVGAEFRFAELRRIGPRVLGVSAAELLGTGLLVGLAVWAVTGDGRLGILASVLATSSAPSATLLTLREVEAEGPTSRMLIQLVGLNNLATLLLFPLALVLAFGRGDPWLATRIALASLACGAAIGLVMAVRLESLSTAKERALLGVLGVLGCIGVAAALGGDPTGSAMLACFGAGVATVNASPHADRLGATMESVVYPLYVLFFLRAGAELHVEAAAHAGMLGVVFLVARSAGKLIGARLGVTLTGLKEQFPRDLGLGLWCQAGVALGLVAALEAALPAETAELRHVVLASVVFFELVGPFMTRRTAVRAGEVKLANLMPGLRESARSSLREVVEELGRNLGVHHWRRGDRGEPLTVRHVLRRAARPARANLSFEKVLKLLSELGADLLPVVDEEERLLGVISYHDLEEILYDPRLRDLVIAEDLMQPLDEPLLPEMKLADALARMDSLDAHSWPVVDEERRLVGMVERKDVYSTLHRAFASEGGDETGPAAGEGGGGAG